MQSAAPAWPKPAVVCQLIGTEQTPLLVIDHFFPACDWLWQQAQHGAYQADPANFYPGVRAPTPQSYQQALQDLLPLLQQVYVPQAKHVRVLSSAFSLACKPAEQLKPIQMLPHFDTVEPHQLAMVHYLCDGRHGGTAFYRHRYTGFERISAERLQSYGPVLNTNSFVVVRYSAGARVIELQRGEINIDVAHDTSRPLSVIAGGKIIQAVGTAFNVDLRQDHVELIVTDGKVLVGSNAGVDMPTPQALAKRLPQTALAISKGERVDLDPRGKAREQVQKIDAVELAASLSWRSGNLIFRGENLQDALAEISRYTDIQFELADDAKLKTIHVAGMFKTGDVNGLLEIFRSNFNISHERLSRDKILLKYAG